MRAACLDAHGRPATADARAAERAGWSTGSSRPASTVEPDVGQVARLGRARTDALDVMALRHRHRTVHLRATHHRHPVLQEA